VHLDPAGTRGLDRLGGLPDAAASGRRLEGELPRHFSLGARLKCTTVRARGATWFMLATSKGMDQVIEETAHASIARMFSGGVRTLRLLYADNAKARHWFRRGALDPVRRPGGLRVYWRYRGSPWRREWRRPDLQRESSGDSSQVGRRRPLSVGAVPRNVRDPEHVWQPGDRCRSCGSFSACRFCVRCVLNSGQLLEGRGAVGCARTARQRRPQRGAPSRGPGPRRGAPP
jgi:hypothetical protein